MTNRERAFHWVVEARLYKTEAARNGVVEAIERALNAERKAGEIEGQIRVWEVVRASYSGRMTWPQVRTIEEELGRLRAEKEKLG